MLDEKPNLPPGRVKVMMESVHPTAGESNNVIAVLARVHAAQAQCGHVPRSAEELGGYLTDIREERNEIEHIQERCRRQREGQRPPEAE